MRITWAEGRHHAPIMVQFLGRFSRTDPCSPMCCGTVERSWSLKPKGLCSGSTPAASYLSGLGLPACKWGHRFSFSLLHRVLWGLKDDPTKALYDPYKKDLFLLTLISQSCTQ